MQVFRRRLRHDQVFVQVFLDPLINALLGVVLDLLAPEVSHLREGPLMLTESSHSRALRVRLAVWLQAAAFRH